MCGYIAIFPLCLTIRIYFDGEVYVANSVRNKYFSSTFGTFSYYYEYTIDEYMKTARVMQFLL
jgi:hypothetical protein